MSQPSERNKRILTTHTGSLPRPDALSGLLFAKMAGRFTDPGELSQQTGEAVAAIVKMQADLGIDIVSDGEQSGSAQAKWACTAPIRYTGQAAVAADLANLRRALREFTPVDVFVPSVS